MGWLEDGVLGMTSRTCSAVACQARIGMGATFCEHHWFMLPSAMQMSIAGLAKRAKAGQASAVQHRFIYAMMQARQAVAKAEKRGFPPIAPAYKAQAEEESRRHL